MIFSVLTRKLIIDPFNTQNIISLIIAGHAPPRIPDEDHEGGYYYEKSWLAIKYREKGSFIS